MPVKLDASGNIDTAALEGDLRSALAADSEYRRTDNMKKRAVRVAKSYDEFKNMVACANLTPVSREEMESLGAVKRGWKKQAASLSSSKGSGGQPSSADGLTSSLLAGEADISNAVVASMAADALKPDVKLVKPTRVTAVDFLKHWKRLPSHQERFECEISLFMVCASITTFNSIILSFRYLEKLGIPSICSIFSKSCEVDVLEQVLQVVMDCATAPGALHHFLQPVEVDSLTEIRSDGVTTARLELATLDTERPTGTTAPHTSQPEWVRALMSVPSFGFNVNFLNPTLRNRIMQMLQNSGCDESVYKIFAS
jgi:hypothetical protein